MVGVLLRLTLTVRVLWMGLAHWAFVRWTGRQTITSYWLGLCGEARRCAQGYRRWTDPSLARCSVISCALAVALFAQPTNVYRVDRAGHGTEHLSEWRTAAAAVGTVVTAAAVFTGNLSRFDVAEQARIRAAFERVPFVISGGSGATYYVSTTGNDSDPGTIGSPFLTIRHAVSVLTPGDTLYIRGGTYTGSTNTIDSLLGTVPSGTDYGAGVITISGYPSESVILRHPDGTAGIQLTSTAHSYIVFQDLTVDGINGTNTGISAIVYLSQGQHHIRFDRVEVANAWVHGVNFYSSGTTSHHLEFINGSVHGSGRSGTLGGPTFGGSGNYGYGFYVDASDCLFEGNEVYANGGYGMQIVNDRHVIRNNVIHSNGVFGGSNYGLVLGAGIYPSTADALVYNNLIYGNRGGILVYSNSRNAGIFHNTVTGNLSGIDLQYYASAPTVQNNIVFANGSGIVDKGGTGTPIISDNLTEDPLFTDPANGDYTLQLGSPALQAGVVLAGVTDDVSGSPRGSVPSLGAYEGIGTTGSPIPAAEHILYQETWQTLKTNSGISGTGAVDMVPWGGTARDGDYPDIGNTDSVKIVNNGTRNVLAANTVWGNAGVEWDRGLGPVAGAGNYPNWLSLDGRTIHVYADYHITTASLAGLTYAICVELDRVATDTTPRIGLDIDLGFSPPHVRVQGQRWNEADLDDDSATVDLADLENKRIRFGIRFKPGTMDAGATTVQDDGFMTFYMKDLDSLVETTLFDVQNTSLYFSYAGEAGVVPGNNQISAAQVGYVGLIGYNEQFVIAEPGATVRPVPPLPPAGVLIDNSVGCCGSTPGGSAPGPVATPAAATNWYRACAGGGVVPLADDVVDSEDWTDQTPPKAPDGWLTIFPTDGPDPVIPLRWGLKPLSDRGRFVEGRLIEVGGIERRSSDKDGFYAAARLRVVAQDDDGVIRGLLGSFDTRHLLLKEARFDLLSYAGRKAGLDPIPQIQGRIVNLQPRLNRQIELEIQDIVGAQFGILDPNKTIGLEIGDEHPTKPETSVGRIYPIAIGEVSDYGQTDATGASAEKGVWPVVDCGEQLLPGQNPDPEGRLFDPNLAAIVDQAIVNLIPGGDLVATTFGMVSAISADGFIGPPSNTLVLDPNGNGAGGLADAHTHRHVWMEIAGGAPQYIVWRFNNPAFHPITNPLGDAEVRYKVVDGTPTTPAFPPKTEAPFVWDLFCDFESLTDGDLWGRQTAGPPENLQYTLNGTPGTTRWVFALSSITALSESRPSAPIVIDDGPAVLNGTDSIHLTADLPTDNGDAVQYIRVLGRRANPPSTYLAIVPIAASPGSPAFDWTDDGTLLETAFNVARGGAAVANLSMTWMVVAQGIVKSFTVYGSDLAEGTEPKRVRLDVNLGDIITPESEAWPHDVPYRIVGGIAQSGFYATGPRLQHHRDGIVTFAVNVCGYTDTGSPPLVINQAFRMLLILLNEFVEKNNGAGYRSGAFGPIETFADGTPKFLTSKFEAAQDLTKSWLDDDYGYVGAIGITEPTALGEILRRFFVTFGGHGTTNHRGQWYPYLIDPDGEGSP